MTLEGYILLFIALSLILNLIVTWYKGVYVMTLLLVIIMMDTAAAVAAYRLDWYFVWILSMIAVIGNGILYIRYRQAGR
jgi:hypothetical protein